MSKVHYFLKQFPSLEWSGPAWYSQITDENGFPSIITLEYWHPLHLGTASETDWDGKELIKIYKPLRKEFPEIGKSWVQGNIHSHHSMGSFFSGTDNQQMIDGANEGMFYYSLVVSSKPGKELYFGTSYPDQFGQIHITIIDDIEIESTEIENAEWKKQAAIIKKRKSKQPQNRTNIVNTGNYQPSLFNLERSKNTPLYNKQTESWSDRYEDELDFASYNGYKPPTYTQFAEYDAVMLDYERGRIKKRALNAKLKKIGVDEYGRPLST